MTKTVKEFLLDQATGIVYIEYDDSSVLKYNLSNILTTSPLTSGIGIFSGSDQIIGDASPQLFITRSLVSSDNGMVLICNSAQIATVNTGMVSGFGSAFKGAISFVAGSGVSIQDVRITGSSNPWCSLVNTGLDTYDIVGAKA